MVVTEEQDLKNPIHRLEDKLLRCKRFDEQLQLHYVIQGYNKKLSAVIYRKENKE